MSQGEGERTGLMEEGKKEKRKPDWSRFGLSAEQQRESQRAPPSGDFTAEAQGYTDPGGENELFRQEQNLSQRPWWKTNFFISEPVLFGTWDGVFTSTLINLLSVIIFVRMGWIVGNAGIGLSVLVILMSVALVLIVAFSAIGVCERCRMEGGGTYFLVAHVLGARIGGAIGIIYCFGQAVACSLSLMGFGESIMNLINQTNPWIARGIAFGVMLLLMVINVAGVKWVIRLQLLLLLVLFLACMDFIVGSFVHTDPENGVTGYSEINWINNTNPDFDEGENFFTIFGLFFSSVTGILAGINMSGDLRDPFHNIPTGTLSSLGVATFLYMAFVFVLGASCVHASLLENYMIANKVAIVGVLWLAGLYLSSVSACMGSLYGPPRILQSIANENVIPIIRKLGQGRGPNKVPIYALIAIMLVALLFICVGDVNMLAAVVTTAFLITYAAVDYSYFALAMSYDRRQTREARFTQNGLASRSESGQLSASEVSGTPAMDYGTLGKPKADHQARLMKERHKDSFEKLAGDLDKLFPERMAQRGQPHLVRQSSTGGGTSPDPPDFDATKRRLSTENAGSKEDLTDTTQLIGEKKQPNTEIMRQPRSWYSHLCNRWVSLLGTVVCLVILFATQWIYALVEICIFFIIYFYIGQASPGYFPGIAEFNLYEWIKEGIQRCCRRGPKPPEQIIVAPTTPAVQTLAAQLTEDNEDFASRGRYHQSEVVKGENFDDYED